MIDLQGLAALNRFQLIKAKNYGFVHFESPDERGIDVALIYKKTNFTVKNKEFHRINFPNSNDKTRDILQVIDLQGLAALNRFQLRSFPE